MGGDGEVLVHAAQRVGEHALPIFGLLLALLLAVAWAGWWAMQRHLIPRARTALPPLALLALCAASGFVTIVAGGWVFAEVAEGLQAQAAVGRADQALTDAIRLSVPLLALRGFAAVTTLANTATLTVLGIVGATGLLALRQRALALGWVAAVAGNGALNQTLKQVFERVRPVHDDGLVAADGYSFPSGHSSGAVVAFGMLAYLALRLLPPRWHLPLMLAAVTLAFTVGASRVFLRVHFASDVLAGFASGTAWLAVCIASIEFTRWVRRRPPAP